MVGSEVDLLGKHEGIVHLDPEVPDGALQLGMTEQELTGPHIARALVQEGYLGPT